MLRHAQTGPDNGQKRPCVTPNRLLGDRPLNFEIVVDCNWNAKTQ